LVLQRKRNNSCSETNGRKKVWVNSYITNIIFEAEFLSWKVVACLSCMGGESVTLVLEEIKCLGLSPPLLILPLIPTLDMENEAQRNYVSLPRSCSHYWALQFYRLFTIVHHSYQSICTYIQVAHAWRVRS
jgi:hypothetical protein